MRGSGEIPVLLLLFISREFHVLPTHCISALHLAGGRGCDVPLPSWSHLAAPLPAAQPHLTCCSRAALSSCCVLHVTSCLWSLPGCLGFQWTGRLFLCRLSLGLQVLPNILGKILVEETLILPSCPSESRIAPAWAGEDEVV